MLLKKINFLSINKKSLLLLLILSIAFFGLFINSTAQAVPPPTLNYNLTWNSAYGENFTSNVDVLVQVNGGIKDSKVARTDQNGYFWTGDLDVAIGDTITVLDPNLNDVSMIVANLSAEMAVDGQNADQVWGQGPSNDQVKVQINPDEESDSQTAAATRIADINDQGNFTADFSQAGQGEPAFDILYGDRAQIVYTSALGHNTIVSLGTPVLTADLTNEMITGDSFAPSSQVNVSVNGGQSQLVEVMEWGSFELKYPGLKAGDNIQVDTGNGIYAMEVAALSTNPVDFENNVVSGNAPVDSKELNVEVWRGPPFWQWSSMSPEIQPDTTFFADFDNAWPEPYFLSVYDEITVIQRATSGHYTEIKVQRAPEHITVNYSHDWVEIDNFDSNGQDLIIKVNGGVANGGVEKQVTPGYGGAHANFSDSGYQIKPGDNISVWDLNNNQLAQMTVASIKGLVDPDNEKVTGTVPPDTESIKGELFPPGDYPKGSIEWQDGTITGNNYQINFQEDVLPRSEVWVHQYSTDNYNETIYVASKPRLTTNFSHDWVNGDYLPVQEGTPIQVQVARNGSPVGSIGNTEVNPYGSFNMNWEDDENRPDIQPGDEVTASWAGGSISMTVQELTADVKYNENTVTGNAPPNTEVSVRVNRGDNVEWPEMDDTSDGNGDFGVDFDDHKDDEGKDDPVDITPEDEVWVHQYAGDGNETILVTGTSYLATNFTNDWVEGYYLPKETAIAVQVNRPGSGQQGVTGNTSTDSNGHFNMNWYEVDGLQDIDRPDIQIGDEVIVSWDGGNASMTVQNVTAKVDHGNNFVEGTAPDGTGVSVMVNNEWPGANRTADGGEFSVDFDQTDPPVDIRPRDRIEVRQFDTTNGDQTILDTGTPILTTNINHGWVGGSNFPAYEKVFIQVTRGGGQVGDVGSTFAEGNGNIWYGWNEEGERVPDLKPGDIVNASWSGGSAQMTVANIGGVMDPGWDRVTGQVPPQTEEIRGELFPPGDYPKDWIEEQTASISGSDYTLDFNTNLTSNYEVWVYHNATDGNETILIAGNWPVASLTANPNPALVGQPITLDASGSKHFVTATTKSIVRYEWDFGYDGTFNKDEMEQLGDPNFDGTTTRTFNQPGPVQVAVRVTDNNNPERVDVEVITLQLVSIDTVPDPFSFTDQIDVPLSSLRESNQIVVSGINSASPISIIGGEYSVNNLPFNNAVGFVNNGDLVKVRQTSASSYSTTTNAILTIGGISDTFSVTTIAQPQVGGNTGGGQQPGPGGQPGGGASAPAVNKNQAQINALNKQIKALNKKIASYNKQIKNLKKKLKKANAKQKAALKKKINKINKQLKILKKKVANLKNKLKKLK